jgi:protein-disulfide isomerase
VKRIAMVALAFVFSVGAAPNWVGSVRQQSNGAYVMGNPAARVKLIEYFSYTCSHCAHFGSEAKLPLRRDYIAKGTVNIELRHAVRDRFDFAAALLARCGGGAKFFGNTDALLESQATWLGKASEFEAANAEKMSKLSINDSLKLIARGVGLDAVMKARGFTPVQIDACLTSKPEQDKIIAMTSEAWNVRKIPGTPAFLVNGNVAEKVGTWATLEPQLKSAAMAVR